MTRYALPAMLFVIAIAAAGRFYFVRAAGRGGKPSAQGSQKAHKITVTFDYDFKKTPACAPPKVKDKCVAQFNVYDISAGVSKRAKLFSIPAPAGETKPVTGITATSPARTFESGKHLISVTAQETGGAESDPQVCTVWVEIP